MISSAQTAATAGETPVVARPWRRSAESLPGQPLSVDANEFHPSCSTQGTQAWTSPQENAVSNGTCVLNLDQYSDASDDEAPPASAKGALSQPTASQVSPPWRRSSASSNKEDSSNATTEVNKAESSEPAEAVSTHFPWRRVSAPKKASATEDAQATSTASSGSQRLPPWKRAAQSSSAQEECRSSNVEGNNAEADVADAEPTKRLPPWKRAAHTTTNAQPTVEAAAETITAEKQVKDVPTDECENGGQADTSEPECEVVEVQTETLLEESPEKEALGKAVEAVPLEETETDSRSVATEPEAELSGREEEYECHHKAAEPESTVFNTSDLLRWRAATDVACVVYILGDAKVIEEEEAAKALAKKKARLSLRDVGSSESASEPRFRPSSMRNEDRPSDIWRVSDQSSDGSRVRGAPKLEVSENSWAAQQRARKGRTESSDADAEADSEVVRSIKSILNKLTLEKFTSLYQQLVGCGIRKPSHIQLLIREVFEKATTQHHFIDMYANLCAMLHDHFQEHPITTDAKFSFKRLLLNACQESFERHLAPPAGLDKLPFEERTLEEVKYKTRMLGNIRFVGALLVRKMLASKVLIAVVEELLSDSTPEALESVAALLTVVGPTFDIPSWTAYAVLNSFFARISDLVQKKSCEPRARCLLKDLLDLRAGGWNDKKPKRLEGPMVLSEVANKAAAEEGSTPFSASGRARLPSTPVSMTSSPKVAVPVPRTSVGSASPFSTLNRSAPETRFDQAAYRQEIRKALAELRTTHEVREAAARIAGFPSPPAKQQPSEFCNFVGLVIEEGRAEVRKAGFETAANLLLDGHWGAVALNEGLKEFMEVLFEDLSVDVPALPRILSEELKPALASVTKKGLVSAGRINELLSVVN